MHIYEYDQPAGPKKSIRRYWGGAYDPIARKGLLKWESAPRFGTKLFLYQAEFLRDVIERYVYREAMARHGMRPTGQLRVAEFYEEQDEYDVRQMMAKLSGEPPF